MADIELVIKIPEEVYDFTKGAKTARTYNTEYYVNLIIKGTPLEKELEKIKTELQSPEEIGLDFFDGLDYAERVIDKRIEELKGE